MWAQIRATLAAAGLSEADTLVVGLSGGPDSVALTHMLMRERWKIQVGHLDHGLRPTSGKEAEDVSRLCDSWGLPCTVKTIPATDLGGRAQAGLEERGRAVRYEFLFGLAQTIGASAVLTAHTADDQVETILMHLLRGSGLAGLAGMRPSRLMPAWSSSIPLVRPMLGVWRREIEAYCRAEALPVVDDESNRDERWLRNWVRHQLIPALTAGYPRAREAIERLGGIAREEDDFLSEFASGKARRLASASPHGYIGIQRAQFAHEELAIQRRLVRRWVQELNPGCEPDFDLIELIVDWMTTGEGATWRGFGGAIWGVRLGDQIRLANSESALAGPGEFPALELECLSLDEEGVYPLSQYWELRWSRVEERGDGESEPPALGLEEVRFSGDAIESNRPVVRKRRTGDRMFPFGMGGRSAKLSDLFINHKIPEILREAWPVVCLGETPVWIPHLRASAEGHYVGEPPYWRMVLARSGPPGS